MTTASCESTCQHVIPSTWVCTFDIRRIQFSKNNWRRLPATRPHDYSFGRAAQSCHPNAYGIIARMACQPPCRFRGRPHRVAALGVRIDARFRTQAEELTTFPSTCQPPVACATVACSLKRLAGVDRPTRRQHGSLAHDFRCVKSHDRCRTFVRATGFRRPRSRNFSRNRSRCQLFSCRPCHYPFGCRPRTHTPTPRPGLRGALVCAKGCVGYQTKKGDVNTPPKKVSRPGLGPTRRGSSGCFRWRVGFPLHCRRRLV